MPVQVLHALVITALCWKWRRMAVLLVLGFFWLVETLRAYWATQTGPNTSQRPLRRRRLRMMRLTDPRYLAKTKGVLASSGRGVKKSNKDQQKNKKRINKNK